MGRCALFGSVTFRKLSVHRDQLVDLRTPVVGALDEGAAVLCERNCQRLVAQDAANRGCDAITVDGGDEGIAAVLDPLVYPWKIGHHTWAAAGHRLPDRARRAVRGCDRDTDVRGAVVVGELV